MSDKGIIFDADDTLWMTMSLYTAAKKQYYKAMAELGFDPLVVEQEFERIDLENVHTLGLSRKRFPYSMGHTYEWFCSRERIEIDSGTKKQLEAIGQSVFDQTSILLPGVKDALELLRPQFNLILASSGDREVQEKRLTESGLSGFFDNIYIFAIKTEKEIGQILDECNLIPSESWAIGNSIRSDINPALKLGINTVWVPYETWGFEKAEVINEKFHRKDNILDAAKFILKQTGVVDSMTLQPKSVL